MRSKLHVISQFAVCDRHSMSSANLDSSATQPRKTLTSICVEAQMRAPAQSSLMPNVFKASKAVRQLIWAFIDLTHQAPV